MSPENGNDDKTENSQFHSLNKLNYKPQAKNRMVPIVFPDY